MIWLSFHIFYWDYPVPLLTESIYPVIKELKRQNKILGFFFIRYNENGPHIRLRVKVTELEKEYVSKFIVDNISQYLQSKPSKTNLKLVPSDYLPNNSIQLINYIPEYQRYGGEEGIKIAEYLFESSSEAVLQLLETQPAISYDGLIGYAVKMHIIFGYGLGLQKKQMQSFFNRNFDHTFFFIDRWKSQKPEVDVSKSAYQDKFSKIFGSKADILVPFIANFLIALSRKMPLDDAALGKWLYDVKAVKKMLVNADSRGELIFPAKFEGRSKPMYKRFIYLYNSYLHMTNNRIGINTVDEPYLSFLIFKSMEAINENKKAD